MEGKDKRKSIVAAYLLAWLVPGAGHWYAGHKRKGISLFVLIVGLFVSGLAMKGGIFQSSADFISFMCTVGRIGMGFPWVAALFTNLRTCDMLSAFGEIGACYTTVAGLLNFLVVFSIADLFGKEEGKP